MFVAGDQIPNSRPLPQLVVVVDRTRVPCRRLLVWVLRIASGSTYARELGAAVTALGDSAALLDVQKAKLTTGSLNDSGPVGASVVAKESPLSAA